MEFDLEDLLYHPVPRRVKWLDFLGFAAGFLLTNQAITGILLATHYRPSVAVGAGNLPDAYVSVQEIMAAPAGYLVRGLHFWGANALVVVVFLHALWVFYVGAYRRPRHVTWFLGVLLGLFTILFAFSGYLLPWDQQAYWATTVGTAMSTYAPLVGRQLLELARGSVYITGATLTRFYALHTMLLPGLALLAFGVHLALVIRHGMVEVEEALPASYRKQHVTSTDKIPEGFMPFWPNTIARMMLLIVMLAIVLVVLAVVFKPGLGEPADPLNRAHYQPVPVWYFLSIYQFLKYLPGGLDALGIIGIPFIAAVILLGLPFFDRNPSRSPAKRPFAIGIAAALVVSIVSLTYVGWQSTAAGKGRVAVIEHPSFKGDILPILDSNCRNCHGGHRQSGGLNLGSYTTLMKGGHSGSPVKKGVPAESLLIQVLEGKASNVPAMPFGQQPLPATQIQTIKNWVKDGAPNN